MRRGYAASLVLLDDEVGRVLDALDRNGFSGNTLVIFTSDHGDMLGDHGLYVKGAFFYEPCVRVPLIVRWPDSPDLRGRRFSGPVQLRDLAMTVMGAAGASEALAAEPDTDSQDLAEIVRGRRSAGPHVSCYYRNSGIDDRGEYWRPEIHATMIRRGDWKLNWYHGDPGESPGARPARCQLFDLASDPRELRDLAEAPEAAEQRRELTEILLEELAREERDRGSRGGDARPREDQKLDNLRRPTA